MEQKFAIGIDLGGTEVKSALVDQNGLILRSARRPSEATKSRDAIIRNIGIAIKELEADETVGGKIVGVGIGIPGIVEHNFMIGGADNLKDWENFDLGKELSAYTQLPISADNDANLMALGEADYGAAKGLTDVVFITIGTGIGGAMLINGRMYGGFRNRGGEFGHVRVNPQGRMCTCGRRGCLEAQASTTALIADFLDISSQQGISRDRAIVDGRYITNLYKKGDLCAINAFNCHFDALSSGIGGLINIFSPQAVVIGGGISEAGDFYIENIREKVKDYAQKDCAENTTIVRALLGNKAGSIGAAAMVFNK